MKYKFKINNFGQNRFPPGIRRIFTDKPLNMKNQKVHILRVGRKGREAWLSIEGIGNISGETPGSLTRLDVAPILYIGEILQQLFYYWKQLIWIFTLRRIRRINNFFATFKFLYSFLRKMEIFFANIQKEFGKNANFSFRRSQIEEFRKSSSRFAPSYGIFGLYIRYRITHRR